MRSRRTVAVIDVGSTAIRLVVAEIDESGSWRILERAGKPVPLGRDVFRHGVVSRDTLLLSLRTLAGFQELMQAYGIENPDTTVIATSALREARNRDTFVDRVSIKTGFTIDIVEGIEENRLTYIAVQHALQRLQGKLSRSNAIIIEVGGGSTEFMILRRGKVVSAHSINIGTVRIEQQLEVSGSMGHNVRFLRENIRNVREVLGNEFDLSRVRYFIAVGGDARLAADRAGAAVDPMYSLIDKSDYDAFVRSIDSLSVDECVSRLGIPYDQADSLSTGLLMYQQFMEATAATELIVPQVSIREGVLISIAGEPDEELQQEFDSQVLASADSIGSKYQFDSSHAHHVAHLALQLFDQLTSEHGLDRHDRLLLHVAAILHDIGTYVRASGHHKHGRYLVSNSEVFGLHADDLEIVSNVVRYHRKSAPQGSHVSYMSLSREDRMKVLKLSALLRVADALDRAHGQRIRVIRLQQHAEVIDVECDYHGDMSIERYGLVSKGTMFEDVFGLKLRLTQMKMDTAS